MDEAALLAIIKTTNFPVAYHHFKKPPNPPYLIYLFNDSDNFAADNKVFSKTNNYRIEMYNYKKDPLAEKKLEDSLDDSDIFYEKSESFIASEGLYQIVYDITI